MKRFMNKKVAAIGLAAGLALGIGGAAFAYFTNNGGSGTGTGSVGTSTTWLVNNPTTSDAALLPGTGSQTFAFTVKNNGTGNQGLTSVTATVAPHNSGCDASWYSVKIDSGTPSATTATETFSPVVDLAPTVSQPVTVVVTLPDLTTTDQSACEGDTPTVTLAAS
jgi:hypothetical protein